MKIVIDNVQFDYNIGCRLLKTKYGNTPFKGLEDIWEDITEMNFEEIVKDIENIEQRRIAINCLGMEKIYEQVNPELVSKKTLTKTTTWVNENGELETINYEDTYELFKVKGSVWSRGAKNQFGGDIFGGVRDTCFVRFKDTSTDRVYFIWVDSREVYGANNQGTYVSWSDDYSNKIDAIEAIAWTIQTNVKLGCIEEIVRQGDCILIKTKPNVEYLEQPRHLTKHEYLKLLTLES